MKRLIRDDGKVFEWTKHLASHPRLRPYTQEEQVTTNISDTTKTNVSEKKTGIDLSLKTKAELIDLGLEKGVELEMTMKKADLIEKIEEVLSWQ